MNYTNGNLLIKRALNYFPTTVTLNYKKMIIISSYKMTARRLQFNDCLQNSQLIVIFDRGNKKDDNKL